MDHKTNKVSQYTLSESIKGFRRDLERDFFADVSVQQLTSKEQPNTVELVIDIQCNFGLTESLFHLNKGNWGNFNCIIGNNSYVNGFQKQYAELVDFAEEITLDIKEFSIHLNDCSIIVGRLYPNSIVEHIANVFDAISENFVHLTKGLSDMPNEIFVPVFEEKSSMAQSFGSSFKKEDYFNYWGLYFNDNPKMEVYEFKTKSILKGDFFLIG